MLKIKYSGMFLLVDWEIITDVSKYRSQVCLHSSSSAWPWMQGTYYT